MSIKTTLEEYKRTIINEISNPNDPLYKLKKWWVIPEEELNVILNELLSKIKNNDYGLELYSKIVNYLSHIQEIGVCKDTIKDAISELENNIRDNKVNGKYHEDRLFDGTQRTNGIYNRNITNIRELINEKENEEIRKNIAEIFKSNNWGKELKDYCEINNSKFLTEKHFADILDIDIIVENIKIKNIEEIYEFWYALKKMYNFGNVKDYYENDKEPLIKLKDNLKKISEIDNVKKFGLNNIIDFLEQVINTL